MEFCSLMKHYYKPDYKNLSMERAIHAETDVRSLKAVMGDYPEDQYRYIP